MKSLYTMEERTGLPSRMLREDIPYCSQWESAELVDLFVENRIDPQSDPKWMVSGAQTPEEYAHWSRNICGIACLKSILKTIFGIDFPAVGLAKRCASFGGYKERGDMVDGLYYKEFLDFLAHDFYLHGRIYLPLTLDVIVEELRKGNFVIASVSPHIREQRVFSGLKGGHLILLTGYDVGQDEGIIYFHDPAGYFLERQEHVGMSFAGFQQYFAARGMIIEKPAF